MCPNLKEILFTKHAKRRLNEWRQKGVSFKDVYHAVHMAHEVLTHGVPEKLKLRNFMSEGRVRFDIVVVDDKYDQSKLCIVTVIAYPKERRRYKNKAQKKGRKRARTA